MYQMSLYLTCFSFFFKTNYIAVYLETYCFVFPHCSLIPVLKTVVLIMMQQLCDRIRPYTVV